MKLYKKVISVLLCISLSVQPLLWALGGDLALDSMLSRPIKMATLKGLKVDDGELSLLWARKDYSLLEKEKALKSFFSALQLSGERFWVDLGLLKPVDEVLGPGLEYIDIGRIFLEADIQLKRDALELLAKSLIDTQQPVRLRFWIVPEKINVVEFANSIGVEIKRLSLKVKVEVFSGFDSQLKAKIEQDILPVLTWKVNHSSRYYPLRAVLSAIVLAYWYKEKQKSLGTILPFGEFIDKNQLDSSLYSSQRWDVVDYLLLFGKLMRDAVSLEEEVSIVGGGISGTGKKIGSTIRKETIGKVPKKGWQRLKQGFKKWLNPTKKLILAGIFSLPLLFGSVAKAGMVNFSKTEVGYQQVYSEQTTVEAEQNSAYKVIVSKIYLYTLANLHDVILGKDWVGRMECQAGINILLSHRLKQIQMVVSKGEDLSMEDVQLIWSALVLLEPNNPLVDRIIKLLSENEYLWTEGVIIWSRVTGIPVKVHLVHTKFDTAVGLRYVLTGEKKCKELYYKMEAKLLKEFYERVGKISLQGGVPLLDVLFLTEAVGKWEIAISQALASPEEFKNLPSGVKRRWQEVTLPTMAAWPGLITAYGSPHFEKLVIDAANRIVQLTQKGKISKPMISDLIGKIVRLEFRNKILLHDVWFCYLWRDNLDWPLKEIEKTFPGLLDKPWLNRTKNVSVGGFLELFAKGYPEYVFGVFSPRLIQQIYTESASYEKRLEMIYSAVSSWERIEKQRLRQIFEDKKLFASGAPVWLVLAVNGDFPLKEMARYVKQYKIDLLKDEYFGFWVALVQTDKLSRFLEITNYKYNLEDIYRLLIRCAPRVVVLSLESLPSAQRKKLKLWLEKEYLVRPEMSEVEKRFLFAISDLQIASTDFQKLLFDNLKIMEKALLMREKVYAFPVELLLGRGEDISKLASKLKVYGFELAKDNSGNFIFRKAIRVRDGQKGWIVMRVRSYKDRSLPDIVEATMLKREGLTFPVAVWWGDMPIGWARENSEVTMPDLRGLPVAEPFKFWPGWVVPVGEKQYRRVICSPIMPNMFGGVFGGVKDLKGLVKLLEVMAQTFYSSSDVESWFRKIKEFQPHVILPNEGPGMFLLLGRVRLPAKDMKLPERKRISIEGNTVLPRRVWIQFLGLAVGFLFLPNWLWAASGPNLFLRGYGLGWFGFIGGVVGALMFGGIKYVANRKDKLFSSLKAVFNLVNRLITRENIEEIRDYVLEHPALSEEERQRIREMSPIRFALWALRHPAVLADRKYWEVVEGVAERKARLISQLANGHFKKQLSPGGIDFRYIELL